MARTQDGSQPFSSHEPPHTILSAGDGPVAVPASFITDADLSRDGQDLILKGPDGSVIVIQGYFLAIPPPLIEGPGGMALTPALVESFLKQAGPVEFAAAASANDASPVGVVQEVVGRATVTRTDGTTKTLTVGTPVYEGDAVETDGSGAVNIVFIDESSFAVSANARLAIDEYIYDPASSSGLTSFSMLRGLFIYTSGLIGREDPDDVHINTPVGSIGIRGTVIAGNVDTGEITVLEGAIVLRTASGQDVTLADHFETARFQGGQIVSIGTLTANDVSAKFSALSPVAGGFFASLDGSSTPSDSPAPAEVAPNTSGNPADTSGPRSDAAPALAPGAFGAELFAAPETLSSSGAQVPSTRSEIPPATPAGPEATPAPPPADTVLPPRLSGLLDTGASIPLPPPANTPPVIANAAFAIDENSPAGTVVGLLAVDPAPGVTLSYAIVAGNVGNAFAIDSATGQITVNNSPGLDFETTPAFDLTIAVSDGTDTRTAVATIALRDIDEAPTFTSLTAYALPENFTAVGMVTATDPEGGPLVYSLGGTDAGLFAIDPATGVITAINPFDYETDRPTYDLTVTATDAGGLAASQALTIQLIDLNEEPLADDRTFTVQENSPAGTIVGFVEATDPDAGATLTYTIAGGNTGNTFTIDTATGAIAVSDPAALDFETATPFVLSVDVSDGALTRTATITIEVADIILTGDPMTPLTLIANTDDQTLVGGAANDILDQGAHSDITFLAGAGDDAIVLRNAAFHRIDGGAGYDVLQTGIGDLDLSGLTPDRIARLEEIQMTNASEQTLTLSMANIFAMLATSDTGTFTITADNSGFNNLRIDFDEIPAGSPPTGVSATSLAWLLFSDSHTPDSGSGYETYHFGAQELRIDSRLFTGPNTVDAV